MYNCSAGKTTPQWMEDAQKNNLSLRYDMDFRKRIELIQDFNFPQASTAIKMTKNSNFIGVAGIYKPMIKVFDTKNLSLHFERALDAEIVQFEFLTDSYDKMMFLRNDRTLEFHASWGRYHQVRIPKYGRDMAYHRSSCDAIVVGSSSEAFRINLDQGRFLTPLSTDLPGINAIRINPEHGLLAMAGENGVLECWDPRDRTRAASLDVVESLKGVNNRLAATLKSKGVSLTTAEFGADGLSLALGTNTGHVLMYDIRSQRPVLTKDHRYGLPIVDIKFHESRRIISSDSKIIKIWDQRDGTPFTSIEPPCAINDVCLVDDSGVLMLANEQHRMMVYHIPQLGPAPKWCTFLDNLTEEMEEQTETSVYDDYKFTTREELEDWGLSHLIGSNLLRAYMHGFFMDMKLYNRVRTVADPFAYEKYVESKVKEKIEANREGRITMKRRLPNVNPGLAKVLLSQGALKKQVKAATESGDTEALDKVVSNPLSDSRFGSMFTNKDFEIDLKSDEFIRLNPNANHRFRNAGGDDDDEAEEDNAALLEQRFNLVDNEDNEDTDGEDSDEDMVFRSDMKGSSLAMSQMAPEKTQRRARDDDEEEEVEYEEEADPTARSLYPSKRRKAMPAMYALKKGLAFEGREGASAAAARKAAADASKKLTLEERLAIQTRTTEQHAEDAVPVPLRNKGHGGGFSYTPKVEVERKGKGVVDDSARPADEHFKVPGKPKKKKATKKKKSKGKSKKR